MKKFTIAMSLLAMMMLTVSCTKDSDAEDDISKNFTDCYKPESGDGQDQPDGKDDTGPQGEKGEKADNGYTNSVYDVPKHYYYGTWKINDADVEPDLFPYLWNRYWCQRLSQEIDEPYLLNGFEYNFVLFNTRVLGGYSVCFNEFPIQTIIHDIFPETDITNIIFNSDSYKINNKPITTEEQTFLNRLFYQYSQESIANIIWHREAVLLNLTGQSDNALYFEMRGYHFIIVVTTKDNDYFGLSFNIVPQKSILVYDRQSEMISLSIKIASIDIVDKDGTKTTRNLNPEYTVTFTSNAIKDKINLGN